jgi:serine protease AprX
MESRVIDVGEYTIGWLCALPIELAAAMLLLDEKHGELNDPNDETLYTLGRIGYHNVVIGCHPAGQLGIGSVATVAARMQAKLPNLRFGLMVGIGSGVPSKEDVRLGDVVVSQPSAGNGGVVQYDIGKPVPDRFVLTGFLNAPPQPLRMALSTLKAYHLLESGNLPAYIADIESKAMFRRPKSESDILFKPTYDHIEGEETCGKCNPSERVDREPREHNHVTVHYGTIASGNYVIKDARERDSMSSKFGGVLCFETEAAGLMDNWPCLVIRGICDYADSHKNKEWQPYAAATSAAFAKELLVVLPAKEVTAAPTVNEVRRVHLSSHSASVYGSQQDQRNWDTLAAAARGAYTRYNMVEGAKDLAQEFNELSTVLSIAQQRTRDSEIPIHTIQELEECKGNVARALEPFQKIDGPGLLIRERQSLIDLTELIGGYVLFKNTPLFPITINDFTLDQRDKAAVGSDAAYASRSSYVLIQSQKLLTPEQRNGLSGKGLTLHKYVSKNTYLYHRQGTKLYRIRLLDYICYADVYRQEFKLTLSLKEITGRDQLHTTHTVDVVFHDDVDPNSEALRRAISERAHLDAKSLEFSQQKVRLAVQGQYLKDMTSIDEVQAIEEVLEVGPRSRIAREILRADVMPGQLNHLYEGNGEVVAVADTGFDRGNIRYTHPAFATSTGEFQNRVLTLYPMSNITSVNDFTGHGTHVCGLVLGDGSTTDGTQFKGTAPKANLVVQCLGHDFNGIPDNLTHLFRLPYDNNQARVHTNSWGSKWKGKQIGYTRRSVEIDKFVLEHPDLVICFAAGNDAGNGHGNISGERHIGAEAAAKNCITVGASRNVAEYQNEVAAFSSRGPTKDGRIKPDVVAPGTDVLSANSGHRIHPHHETKWSSMSGTSMATPLVAGCAAVLREALRNRINKPSAALIKALLVNGAVPLDQVSPNKDSGFGRVDLANSIVIACREDGANFDQEVLNNGYNEHKIPAVKIPKGRLKVTLVWSDPPSMIGTGAVQNILCLVVRADGREYDGNKDTKGKPLEADNNVQRVQLTGLLTEEADIIIRADQIITDQQPFACAWSV